MQRVFLNPEKFDRLFTGLIFGGAFPVLCCLSAGIIWFYLDKVEPRVLFYLIPGFIAGLIIDWKYLKGWINNRFDLPFWFLTAIYLFYNICMFGVFMGFPVFNLATGIMAGYYMGEKINHKSILPKAQKKIIHKTSLFTAIVMTLICISTASIALTEKTIGEEIRGMLGLHFEITRLMVWAIIVFGGIGLIIAQYLITRFSIIITIKWTLYYDEKK
jgi:hypothetical protein